MKVQRRSVDRALLFLYLRERDQVSILQAGWALGSENLTFPGIRSPDLPACSKSQYRLRCPGIQLLCQRQVQYIPIWNTVKLNGMSKIEIWFWLTLLRSVIYPEVYLLRRTQSDPDTLMLTVGTVRGAYLLRRMSAAPAHLVIVDHICRLSTWEGVQHFQSWPNYCIYVIYLTLIGLTRDDSSTVHI
jgi:hypothetical protein